ncbi:MAG TPA: thioredoxin family protein [Actinomycetota bacterium]|nr:thioredoxin family protein [Actinomycetota bacterium]
MTLRYFDGCPHWHTMHARVGEVLTELGIDPIEVLLERVETIDDAERLRFIGSPTILVDGRDPFEEDAVGGYGLSCRIYQSSEGPAGSPTREQLREVLAAYVDGDATS